MKSPTSRVGRIEELGILNGSATNERSRNTMSSTGKKLFAYSIHQGSESSWPRRREKKTLSASAMTPVSAVSRNSMRAKFTLFFSDLKDGEKRLLGNLDAPDGFHALLARLLFLEELLLSSHIAAVALGEHVLAQRLDCLAGDDLPADGGLDRHVEHLARNERAHPRNDVASPVRRVGAMDHRRKRVHP